MAAFSKTAGPGILFASTAIGVSHLVQSTRAGAEFGLIMISFVILATVFKYPFFEYGSRYANATDTSIIDGYKRLGKWVLWMYFLITLATMFFITAAVSVVTAGFFSNLFGIEFPQEWVVTILFGICITILAAGRYNTLDMMIKVIAIVLLVSTATAFVFALWNGPVEAIDGFAPRELWDDAGIFFLLALMGWMPTALDLSSWNSLWTLERIRQTGYKPKLRQTIFEFRFSYVITAVLGVMFVTLGSQIFFGSGQELSSDSADFAGQVVAIYTQTIGQWSQVIIAASAFTIMFGTILAVFDGYSRALRRTTHLLFEGLDIESRRHMGMIFLFVLGAGSLAVATQFGGNLKTLVDFATVLSFIVAPVIAFFNLRLVTGNRLKNEFQPSRALKIWSVAGIVFLAGFALIFLLTRI